MKPYVVYWNNIPAPYMVERFNALADRDDLDFEAWFSDRIEPGRSWNVDESSWRFRYRYLPTSNFMGKTVHWPVPVLGHRPDVLVSLYAEPSFIIGWLIAKLRGAKTIFWCQVTHDNWVKRSAWKEWLKKLLFKRVDATLGSGEESRAFTMKYGVPAKRAIRLQHSIDVDHYVSGYKKNFENRERIRNEIGVSGTVYIYVGRLWSGKGISYLLKAFELVQRSVESDVSLLLVGDGEEESQLKKYCTDRGIKNVIFAGFHQKGELPRYYIAADVFVFPTLGDPYGLVVDEAMASSLPVISTNAAGEISDRIENGVNGYIVSTGNSESLSNGMLKFVDNEKLCRDMGAHSLEKIIRNTPDKWAEDFSNIVKVIRDA